jgi:hypothetical protein
MSNKYALFALLTVLCLCKSLAFAVESAAPPATDPKAAESKPADPKKDKSKIKVDAGSAIGNVMKLPIVKEWEQWVSTGKDSGHLVAYGEEIGEVKKVNDENTQQETEDEASQEHPCWEVVVAEKKEHLEHMYIWRRFCVMQTGGDIWVKGLQSESDPADKEPTYVRYEKWVNDCKPTYNSPGQC